MHEQSREGEERRKGVVVQNIREEWPEVLTESEPVLH